MYRPDQGEGSLVDPWIHTQVDSATQTGGDWYQLFLATSLGFKSVHGANTAPTCEVLCKADRLQVDLDNYGLISWDETPLRSHFLGYEISDRFYAHHHYRGTVTASGSMLAYESGLWEPSVRRRARSSALLAAGLAVHGHTTVDACRLVSKITGETMDIEAVDSAILPASHLKREMVLVSKATHRLFSSGSLQSGILWHDQKLNNNSTYRNVAFDWGRVTTIARYIAEANIQNCPYFRVAAQRDGIPYSVVRNAWAFVSDSDYRLPLSIFDEVPTIDVKAFGIPSLKGTFIGHEQDVMLALNRSAKSATQVPESDAFKAYVELLREAKKRRGRRDKVVLAQSSEAQVINIQEHTITAGNVLDMLEGARLVRNAYLMAIASRRQCDPAFESLMSKVVQADENESEGMQIIDEASVLIYDRSVWMLARIFAENALITGTDESDDLRDRALSTITLTLSRMRSGIVGYSTHLDTHLVLSVSQLSHARSATIAYARDSSKALPHVSYTQRSLVSRQLQEASTALNRYCTKDNPLFAKVREEVSRIYEEWYEDALREPYEGLKLEVAPFAFISTFLQNLTESTCFQKTSGYMDGTQPRKSYVYQGLVRLSVDLGFTLPPMRRFAYTDANQLALEYDVHGGIPFSVRDAVEDTIAVADDVIGDLMVNKLWKPDPDTYMDMHMKYAPIHSPQYQTEIMVEAELQSQVDAMVRMMETERKTRFVTGYEAFLNTYPSEDLANKYARVMGYPHAKAAFDVLGLDAYYSEENQYIHDARAKIGFGIDQGSPSTSGSKRSYREII